MSSKVAVSRTYARVEGLDAGVSQPTLGVVELQKRDDTLLSTIVDLVEHGRKSRLPSDALAATIFQAIYGKTSRTDGPIAPFVDPVSGLPFPIPAPDPQYTVAGRRHRDSQRLETFASTAWQPYLNAQVLFLESIRYADFSYWQALRHHASRLGESAHSFAHRLGILSLPVIETDQARYAHQAVLLKILSLRTGAQSRLENAHQLLASLEIVNDER